MIRALTKGYFEVTWPTWVVTFLIGLGLAGANVYLAYWWGEQTGLDNTMRHIFAVALVCLEMMVATLFKLFIPFPLTALGLFLCCCGAVVMSVITGLSSRQASTYEAGSKITQAAEMGFEAMNATYSSKQHFGNSKAGDRMMEFAKMLKQDAEERGASKEDALYASVGKAFGVKRSDVALGLQGYWSVLLVFSCIFVNSALGFMRIKPLATLVPQPALEPALVVPETAPASAPEAHPTGGRKRRKSKSLKQIVKAIKKGECTPSQREIARFAGCSKDTALAHLAYMREQGIIERYNSGHRVVVQ